MRCHQSYIVNIEYIQKFNDEMVIMKNGTSVKVSRSRTNEAKQKYLAFKGRDVL